jgi:hypothetical protein
LRYVPLGGAKTLVGELNAFIRRRRDKRRPRVRIRLAHGETRVLADGEAGRERLLTLAGELVADYGRPTRVRP